MAKTTIKLRMPVSSSSPPFKSTSKVVKPKSKSAKPKLKPRKPIRELLADLEALERKFEDLLVFARACGVLPPLPEVPRPVRLTLHTRNTRVEKWVAAQVAGSRTVQNAIQKLT